MKKSEALREAAARITKKTVDYNWYRTESCNCGILAQVVLDMSGVELRTTIGFGNTGPWCMMSDDAAKLLAQEVCPTTGLGLVKVFAALYDMGFTREELEKLEMWEPDSSNGYYKKPECVAEYMNNWAERLEKENL